MSGLRPDGGHRPDDGRARALAGSQRRAGPGRDARGLHRRDLAARRLIKDLFARRGLTVREDAIGNTFARWEGQQPELPPVGTGSHIDAIPHSGRFDGTVGVLGALEAIRALRRAGFQPVRPIELVMFTSEEPTRFGIGCLGSRGMCGSLTPASLAALKDSRGNDVRRGPPGRGVSGRAVDVRLPEGHFAAFVELHIEQGPILERARTADRHRHGDRRAGGAARDLEGRRRTRRRGADAGRRDALCAARRSRAGRRGRRASSGSPDTVATTGVCRVHPGAINSIPDRVTLEIDVRDIDLEPRGPCRRSDPSEPSMRSPRGAVCRSRRVPRRRPACPIVGRRRRRRSGPRATTLDFRALPMISRAYHDSLFMARIAPDRHDLHSVQGRDQPPAGRVRSSRGDLPAGSRCCADAGGSSSGGEDAVQDTGLMCA